MEDNSEEAGLVWDFPVPIDLVHADLPMEARFAYIYLLSKCDRKARTLRAHHTGLAEELHIHRATLRKLVAALEQTGWIQLQRAGRHETIFVMRNPVLEERQAELQRVKARLAGAPFKGEAIMHELLDQEVPLTKYDLNARLGFLRNPGTDQPLELDRWYFEEKVGFEFNGPQHYGPTEAFPDPQKARNTMARDYIKRAICQEHGIRLITITAEDLTPERMEQKIRGILPLRQLRPDDPVLQYLGHIGRQYMRQIGGRPGRLTDTRPHRPGVEGH
ncbi:MAG: hypothetical protein AB1503_09325 [Bacillota bacterium]